MSDQQPPAWNPDHRPTGPYGAPPPPPGTPSQPYGAPSQHTAPLPQYGQPPSQYGNQPPQYGGQPPQYGNQPPQYGSQPPQYGGQPPQGPYSGGQQPPGKRPRGPWLLVSAVGVVVALVAGAVVLLTTRGDDTADGGAPVPTATFTDAVETPTASPSTEPPSVTPSNTPTPSNTSKPTPAERRRTLKDVDQGIAVYDDVYVNPAAGWRKSRSTTYSVTLGATTRAGAAMVVVSPAGISPRTAVVAVAQALIKADKLKAAKQGPVRTVSPANSNIGAQAEMTYSGRYTSPDGAVFSLVARCTTMTGVESIHNVTVTLCIAARKDAQKPVFRDGARMLASVARSI
ncbi:hypothetical protein [Kribbella soli]|uniref:Uncharacterized protein n=1 Tax=Kribbella soli TaxID=1124743 RepID=A0A4R0H3W8_9ACTN|nr:hypothetical protein [Kribbella soli]TCC04358.1 hypothetical protein E0H45_35445 [Kribbella soli]